VLYTWAVAVLFRGKIYAAVSASSVLVLLSPQHLDGLWRVIGAVLRFILAQGEM